MYLIEKVQPLGDELVKAQKSKVKSGDEIKELKKLLDILIKILKLILEETDNGKLEDIKLDTLPINIATDIVKDFFQQFKM
jgi:soluble cytochrome b562